MDKFDKLIGMYETGELGSKIVKVLIGNKNPRKIQGARETLEKYYENKAKIKKSFLFIVLPSFFMKFGPPNLLNAPNMLYQTLVQKQQKCLLLSNYFEFLKKIHIFKKRILLLY